MLISNKNQFIFIHIYKNAGTSITSVLHPFAVSELQWKVHNIFRRLGIYIHPAPYHSHIRASELVSKIGKQAFESYFSFAIVRNPWDWQVSFYNYMLQRVKHPQHELVKNLGNFNNYIEWRCDEEVRYQKDFVFSKNGEQLVNFIGRYENLDNDFKYICSKIGIPAPTLPKLRFSKTKSYQEYYNKNTIELVRNTFAPDIQLFSYDFE